VTMPRFPALFLAQVPGLDPTPYTAWGVLGLLAIGFLVALGMIWRLVVRNSAERDTSSKQMMDFLDRNRIENNAALQGVAKTVADSNDKMSTAFNRQSRLLDELLIRNRAIDRIDRLREGGSPVSSDEIRRIVREEILDRDSTRA
jgi:hypothetical protein